MMEKTAEITTGSILVVDDQHVNRKILQGYLEQQGHKVVTAENGQEAINKLNDSEYDLIILDIIMPEMEGYEVLEHIRNRDQLQDVPVIVISALDDIDSLVKSVELGADDYISKPFNPVLLKARIDASLEKKRLREKEQLLLKEEKRRTEAALQISEERLRTVISNAPVILFVLDNDGIFSLIVGLGLVSLGLAQNQLAGESIFEVYKDNSQIIKSVKRALSNEAFTEMIDLEGLVWETRFAPLWGDNEVVEGVIGVATDVTQRKKAEDEKDRLYQDLQEGNIRLRALSQQLVDVQEIEKRKIAHELHDEVGQSLTGLKISLEMGMRSNDNASDPFLKEAHNLAQEVLSMVREMSLNLRPSMLDDLGLVPTLDWYFERYLSQTNIQVDFEHLGIDKVLDSRLDTAVYRIIQEALTNVARHAKVEKVSVKIWIDKKGINILIEDEGAGFDPQIALEAKSSTGLGGIIDRVKLLDGTITIESAENEGSILRASLPIEKDQPIESSEH